MKNLPIPRAWEADPYWKEVVNVLTGGRKLRPEHYLDKLTAEELDKLQLCLSCSATLLQQQELAPKRRGGAHDGEAPGTTVLGEIAQAMRQVQMLRGLERQTLINAATKARGHELGLDNKLVDTLCRIVGEEALVRQANGEVGAFSLKAASALMKREGQIFDQTKFKESMKKKIDTALDELAKHIKGNATAQKAFDAFKEAVSQATT